MSARLDRSAVEAIAKLPRQEQERTLSLLDERRRRVLASDETLWERYDPVFYVRGEPSRIDDWMRPAADYARIAEERSGRLERLRADPRLLPYMKAYYAENPIDFINDWGCTFDPRNPEIGLPSITPFILFQRQVDWVEYTLRKWLARERSLTDKSRDSGVTWLAVALAETLCIFRRGMVVGFGSRVEDYVDKLGDPKSIFEKARIFLRNLPEELRGGWTESRHSFFMRVIFPETDSILVGEGGDNIGRGNRAQPYSAKLLTPYGWTTIGEVSVGDFVIGSDGKPIRVLGVYERGVRQVFQVEFDDGASTECCDEHLWRVTTKLNRRAAAYQAQRPDRAGRTGPKRRVPISVLPLSKIRQNFLIRNDEYRYQIPLVSAPVEFNVEPLPLDPYIVGALLGDGVLGHMRHTSPELASGLDDEIAFTVRNRLPEHCTIRKKGPYGFVLIDERGHLGRGHRSPIKVAIDAAGIDGLGGADKFVPDAYKFSSPYTRLEVLRGLLDTDGWCNHNTKQVGFCSISERLADDVRFLVESLGGVASKTHIVRKAGTKLPTMLRRRDTVAFSLNIILPRNIVPFRLERKARLFCQKQKDKRTRSIVAVTPVGEVPTRCIKVDASDNLYLTDHLIVTHNTSLYFVDEAAHLERPIIAEASLQNTTNCRHDISTPKGLGNPFEQNRHSGRIEVFSFSWRDDPRKDAAWYAKQLEEAHSPAIVAQEVDIDYAASVEGVIIPAAWVQAATDAHVKLGIELTGTRRVGLDVADEGVDRNAVCVTEGIAIAHVEEWSGRGSDLHESVVRAFHTCMNWDARELRYDAGGMGASVRASARVLQEQSGRTRGMRLVPFFAQGSVAHPEKEAVPPRRGSSSGRRGPRNKDMFSNLKAQAWWTLRLAFESTYRAIHEGMAFDPDEVVSISSEIPANVRSQLESELSQATYATNGAGKIVVNKSPPGTKSPNLADAVVIARAKLAGSPQLQATERQPGVAPAVPVMPQRNRFGGVSATLITRNRFARAR